MSGTPSRTQIAFVAAKATKVAILLSEVMRARHSGTGWYRLAPANTGLKKELFFPCFFLCSVSNFEIGASDFRRDGGGPSHVAGQNPKNINNDSPWDGVMAPEEVGGGMFDAWWFSNHFKAIQRNSNQNKKVLHLSAPILKKLNPSIRQQTVVNGSNRHQTALKLKFCMCSQTVRALSW